MFPVQYSKGTSQVPKNQHTFAEKFSWYGAKVVGVEKNVHSESSVQTPSGKAVE
jgi:hypothetical protein